MRPRASTVGEMVVFGKLKATKNPFYTFRIEANNLAVETSGCGTAEVLNNVTPPDFGAAIPAKPQTEHVVSLDAVHIRAIADAIGTVWSKTQVPLKFSFDTSSPHSPVSIVDDTGKSFAVLMPMRLPSDQESPAAIAHSRFQTA